MWQLIAAVVIIAIGYALTPKRVPTIKPGTIDVTTAEEGRVIPVLFGTRLITGANVVWFGDFSAVAIRKKGGKK